VQLFVHTTVCTKCDPAQSDAIPREARQMRAGACAGIIAQDAGAAATFTSVEKFYRLVHSNSQLRASQ
jgi:hypothetical protein